MPAPRKPQDHKPKAAKALATENGLVPFTFEHDGKTWTLPTPDPDAAKLIGGQLVRDALMSPDDEGAQLRLGIASIEAAVNDPDTLKALYAKPWGELVDIIKDWLSAAGADPGKSEPSSSS